MLTQKSAEVQEEDDDEEDSFASNGPYLTHSDSMVAVLSNASPRYHHQSPTGVLFNNSKDYLVFKTISVAVEFLAFYVEIFSDEDKRIGACFALPSTLSDSFGYTQLPFINSSGRPIGQISCECFRFIFIILIQWNIYSSES